MKTGQGINFLAPVIAIVLVMFVLLVQALGNNSRQVFKAICTLLICQLTKTTLSKALAKCNFASFVQEIPMHKYTCALHGSKIQE